MVQISSVLPCGQGYIQRHAIKNQHVIRSNGSWWTSTFACRGQAIKPVAISKLTWHKYNSDGCYPIVDSQRSLVIVKCTTAPYQARLDTVRAFKDQHGPTNRQRWALTGHYWFNLPVADSKTAAAHSNLWDQGKGAQRGRWLEELPM